MSELDPNDSSNTDQDNPNIKLLREKAEQVPQLQNENKSLKLQLGLRDAGLDLNEAQTKALLHVHGEGELSPEALKTTAEALGYGGQKVDNAPIDANQQPRIGQEDQAKFQQIDSAQLGSQANGTESATDAYARLSTPEEVIAEARRRGSLILED